MRETNRVWSIVLAGGEGERMRPFIERWLGHHRPKQYCNFVGGRSLLQHTVDRADAVAPAARRVTIVSRTHRAIATEQLAGRGGRLLFQPANRGTAAGVFLPLALVREADPHATVVIYPADHFVFPEERFVAAVRQAIAATRACPDRPILLGAVPDRPDGDYGWIVPDGSAAPASGGVLGMTMFKEKPAPAQAADLMAAGGLWNTMVIIGRVDTLWALGRRWVPEVVDWLNLWRAVIGTPVEETMLEKIYAELPARDFSADVLGPSARTLATLPLHDVLWNDWGRPERICDTLAGLGLTARFDQLGCSASRAAAEPKAGYDSGRLTTTVVPSPGALSMLIEP